MKSLVKKVVFGALFLMNVGLVFAHPPVDPPDNPYVPPRAIEIAEELHEVVVSPFEKRKAEKKSELECKFKEEFRGKLQQISRCIKSGDQKKLKAVTDDFKSWHEKRKAELELELKNYCKEIDSEFKDKARKGELEIEWDLQNTYNDFEPQTFTTDIPQCVLNKKALRFNKFEKKNGYVVYVANGTTDTFAFTSIFDMLVRGSGEERSYDTSEPKIKDLSGQPCLLLDEKTCDFIESKQPGWKPSSTFTVDECFNLSVNFSADGFCNLFKSQESK